MKHKKILIIAHFYEPCNVIASHRPKSWAKSLLNAGFEPVVVTRHWTGKEQQWDELLAENTSESVETVRDGVRVISLPFRKNGFHKLATSKLAKKLKVVRFGIEWLASALGRIEIDRDVNQNYFEPVKQLMQKETFALILVTCNPYNGAPLAARLSNASGVPWIADFRDLWDVSAQKTSDSSVSLADKIRFMFYNKTMFKALKTAHHIVVCSEAFVPFFEQHLSHIQTTLIKNGFESQLFDNYPDTSQSNDSFTILCAGTLYEQQDKQTFADGVKAFLLEEPDARLRIIFMGIKVNPAVCVEIESLFPPAILETTAFVDRTTALKALKNAHVLFYPVWKGYYGIYSGKLFEYLGAHKNILIAPNDNGTLEQLLIETNAGAFPSTALECKEQLLEWYTEWKNSGTLSYKGNEAAIGRYTREAQGELLVSLVTKALNEKG